MSPSRATAIVVCAIAGITAPALPGPSESIRVMTIRVMQRRSWCVRSPGLGQQRRPCPGRSRLQVSCAGHGVVTSRRILVQFWTTRRSSRSFSELPEDSLRAGCAGSTAAAFARAFRAPSVRVGLGLIAPGTNWQPGRPSPRAGVAPSLASGSRRHGSTRRRDSTRDPPQSRRVTTRES
jgi:hypothetical protein